MELGINYIFEFVVLWIMFIFKKIWNPDSWIGVDFIDFSSGVRNYYKFINYEYWSIFVLVCTLFD